MATAAVVGAEELTSTPYTNALFDYNRNHCQERLATMVWVLWASISR